MPARFRNNRTIFMNIIIMMTFTEDWWKEVTLVQVDGGSSRPSQGLLICWHEDATPTRRIRNSTLNLADEFEHQHCMNNPIWRLSPQGDG